MLDCHVHIERGQYTEDWINQFVQQAKDRGLNEIWLLEHCYRFREFVPMYDNACAYSDYVNQWFGRKAGALDFPDSVHFIDRFAYDHKPEHWQGVNVDNAYRRYFETSVDLANSGIFSGIAHPDCIKLFGHKPSFSLDKYYDQLAAALAKNHMYAEQSGGAHSRCPETAELGMADGLIKALRSHNVRIQTASDAHCPEDVGLPDVELERILAG
jgi:histidinol-phosphatase (PHP family)